MKDGKLTLVSADGYRIAVQSLDISEVDGEVLIHRDELKGIPGALKRARRLRFGMEKVGEKLDAISLVLETELIKYRWRGAEGTFPDYQRHFPAQFNTLVSFDTSEALRAVNSLKILSESKSYPIDLTIGNGKIVVSSPDEKGQTEITAETQGEVKIRLNGGYLADALKACGGMVELKLVNSTSPMVFSVDGFELATMPMHSGTTEKPAEAKPTEAVQAEAVKPSEPVTENVKANETPTGTETTETVKVETTESKVESTIEEKAQAIAEAEAITKTEKSKRKPKKTREPVTV